MKDIEKLAGWTYFKKEGVPPDQTLSRLLVSLCLFPKRERADCRDDERIDASTEKTIKVFLG